MVYISLLCDTSFIANIILFIGASLSEPYTSHVSGAFSLNVCIIVRMSGRIFYDYINALQSNFAIPISRAPT